MASCGVLGEAVVWVDESVTGGDAGGVPGVGVGLGVDSLARMLSGALRVIALPVASLVRVFWGGL